jgi:hypothetical protein
LRDRNKTIIIKGTGQGNGAYQIGHLDEPLEPGVVLDVEAVEGDAAREVRRRWVDEVADLVAVDVDCEDDVVRIVHELLAEVGADEAASADHADGEGRDGVAVQIQAGARLQRRRRHPPRVPRRGRIGECGSPAWVGFGGDVGGGVASLSGTLFLWEGWRWGRIACRLEKTDCWPTAQVDLHLSTSCNFVSN